MRCFSYEKKVSFCRRSHTFIQSKPKNVRITWTKCARKSTLSYVEVDRNTEEIKVFYPNQILFLIPILFYLGFVVISTESPNLYINHTAVFIYMFKVFKR